MNPTSEQVKIIRGMVKSLEGGWARNNHELVTALNEPMHPNPKPAPDVPKPFTLGDVLGVLSIDSAAALKDFGHLYYLIQAIKEQDSETVSMLTELLTASGDITPEELAELKSILTRTIPDPTHPPMVGWAEAHLGRTVDTADLNIARHSIP